MQLKQKKIIIFFICLFMMTVIMGCGKDVPVERATGNQPESNIETTQEINQMITETNNTLEVVLDSKAYTKEELLSDFDQFKRIIESSHPKLYTDKDKLEALIEEKKNQIRDGMTELDFYRLLSPIATVLNCGHTNVSLSQATESTLFQEQVMFPLYLHWIGEKAYVTQNTLSDDLPIGAEILSINGKTMSEIKAILLDNFPADGENLSRKTFLLNHIFNYFYALIIEANSSFDVVYRPTPEGDTDTATLTGVSSSQFNDKIVSDWIDYEMPFKGEFENGYATLTFYSFYPEGKFTITDYNTFIDHFFTEIKEQNINKLILDVRENSGGDPNITSHLFSYLANFEQPYFVDHGVGYYRTLYNNVPLAENHFSGKLAILMDGMSFSSTGHLLALLKYQDIGTYFGEESGGSFACTDSSQNFVLTNTRLQFHSSTSVWEVMVDGLTPGRGILPDFQLQQSLSEYLTKDDIVKEAAVKWLKEEQ